MALHGLGAMGLGRVLQCSVFLCDSVSLSTLLSPTPAPPHPTVSCAFTGQVPCTCFLLSSIMGPGYRKKVYAQGWEVSRLPKFQL